MWGRDAGEKSVSARSPFKGAGTALVTPFTRDGGFDEGALRRLVRRQVEEGIDFLVPCGTTGETPTLSGSEKARAVILCVEEANGRVPVLAGAGSNDTRKAVDQAKAMAALGAQGILSVGPYYNKTTPEGFYGHFSAVADASPVPVVI
jgi:4-hydroxy-tetrahydrodipicolinate synthase